MSTLERLRTSSTPPSLLVAALGGLIAAASLPPFGFWPMGPLGVAMFLLALEDHPWSRRAATGLCFGLGLLVPGLWWAQHFNWFGAVALMAIESLFFAAAAIATCPGRGRTLSAIGALTLAEAARESWPLGGLPIGGLPLGQVGGPLLPIARLAGPAGMVMAVVVVAAGARIVTTGLAARSAHAPDAARRFVHGLGLLGLVVIQLAAAQHVPTGTRLTVLPEDVVGLPGPLRGSWQLVALRAQARRISTTLLAGVTSPVGSTRFANTVVALGPTGRIIGSVTKVHRVPFGEYVPARSLVSRVADLSAVPRDATVGTRPEVLLTPAGHLGVLISFETFFSSLGATLVAHGADQHHLVPRHPDARPGAGCCSAPGGRARPGPGAGLAHGIQRAHPIRWHRAGPVRPQPPDRRHRDTRASLGADDPRCPR